MVDLNKETKFRT